MTPPPGAWMDRIAHDLRGPLAPMQTAVYLLRDPDLGADQRDELLAVLERQVQRLGGMIDELGDMGRAQGGRLLASREAIDVELLLADTVARLRERAPRVEFGGDCRGLALHGDIQRIAQLFLTLLDPRLPPGPGEPAQARVERVGDRLRMACSVRCHGASDALAASLLSSPHPDPVDDALGLALVIASEIARAHGGELQARAGADGGSLEFLLELPLAGD